MTRINLDDEATAVLAKQGLDFDSVPAAGQAVPLRGTANLSTGGTATDVTDVIHPDNREMAVRAVTAIAPGRGRRRLPLPRYHRELQDRGRWHLRGQRGAGVPHARSRPAKGLRAMPPAR